MNNEIKICGLRDAPALDAALDAGADLVGFVQFPKSPRHIALDMAGPLSQRASGKALRVALAVDPDDAALEKILAAIDPDILQLHGRESPQRVTEIRHRFGVNVMKAIGIADAADLAQISVYRACCDRILVDAKPPAMPEALPGGNGLTFDWQLIAGLDDKAGLMLSGGLNPANVGDAIALTGVDAVDVSSGVESAPGEKDPQRIAQFIEAARAAFRQRAAPSANEKAKSA
ncbi:MAG: phosphoribosylanthranilate isomerase TrpF [Saliniramus fredricksonii]|uniref:N-(5'-phosphoribosyl)anthranilate isomerase n=1 Tax=Saliniramus fredricksonii TaxID=1653334 RepID=A0A0P7ZYX1_9HYPH|nr:phosphoribosylanthranilate isomerase [Saliniramus fredricksonii]KPQ10171.1 MAG: phosphoribosylanthranilate isomerase TrpF [Saliniramus fredricksonii]SCC79234.1 phosphoribosylanthranilate isomerase [Saliniramus fredricksonii]